uniref:RELT like 1 n=1 Tax=Sphenodon punctatus TaxID=8508 RepID=A0A8D0GLA1_SPHPU
MGPQGLSAALGISPAAAASAPGNEMLPDSLASHGLESTTASSGSGHTESGQLIIAFTVIPVFFIMGLLGILFCHILKKKGYRCTTETEEETEEEKLGEKIEMNETLNENGDTVGQIVNSIMRNEANADVLKAMVADNSTYDPESPRSPTTPGSPTSPGSLLSPTATPSKHNCRGLHLHTVGGAVEKDVCSRCKHKRWHLPNAVKKSKEPRRARNGEVTVLSVGRFRVTKVEHKSALKERKNLVSISDVEGVNSEMPSSPVKQGSKEVPSSPVKQGSRGGTDTPLTKREGEREL